MLVGIGIAAGPAVPVEDGYRGAALNLAARLCALAAAGKVLVTPDLAAHADGLDGIAVAPLGTAELKGFERRVELVEVSGRAGQLASRSGPTTAPLPPELEPDPPLVGRERELAWLRGTWRQAQRGAGRIVFVSGPEQIGKTRLVAALAEFVADGGGAVAYAGSGGAAAGLALSALREAAASPHATLVVLDDLDPIAEAVVPALDEAWERIEASPLLVVGLVTAPDASPRLAALVERADRRGDGRRELPPLDAAGVGAIATLYAGDDVAEAPLETIERASGGVPGRVHEIMSEWAQTEASRRLAAASEWLAADRRRQAANLEFANNVIGLKLGRLYAAANRPALADGGSCPYKGLAPFGPEDAAVFFGRERLIGELAARTVGDGLLAVVGASGSGKSSVIAAGLLPSLAAGILPGSDRWRAVAMRPGGHPLATWESRAPHTATGAPRTLYVIDQCEELFTSCRDEAERAGFVDLLVEAARDPERACVILGVRGDYYGHFGVYPELARLLAANQVLVGQMSADELRRAIELPARRAGIRVESGLSEALVAEVADEPGGLPLLSTALVELWQACDDSWLRLAHHERLGGVDGAVARLAEHAYGQLDEPQRAAARSLFLRLVAISDAGVPARRRVQLDELDVGRNAELAAVVASLTDDRLLTAHGDAVELAHEALLREWPRLGEWLVEDAQGRQLREHLVQGAKRWDAAGRDPAELYRGARLSATLEWAAGRAHELNELERGFLTESRRESELDAARQRRANRRLRGLLVGVVALLALALAAGIVALIQRQSARNQARVALARQLGAEAVVEPRIDRAMLLARESLRLDGSPETEGTLLSTLLRSPAAVATFSLPLASRPLPVAVSPDGRTVAVGDDNQQLFLFDTRTRRLERPAIQDSAIGVAPAFSRNGSRLALLRPNASGSWAAIDVRDAHTFRRVRLLLLDRTYLTHLVGFVDPIILADDGQTAYFAYSLLSPRTHRDGPTYVDRWDVRSGRRMTATLEAKGLHGAALVDGGRRLVLVGDTTASTLDTATMQQISRMSLPANLPAAAGMSAAAVHPNGGRVGIAYHDGTVALADLRRHHPATLVPGAHDAPANVIAYSPDGRIAADGGDDGRVIIRDAASGRPLETLDGQGGRVLGLAFSADGRSLFTSSLDGAVFEWDMSGARRFGRPFTAISPPPTLPPAAPPALAVSPDGARFATPVSSRRVGIFGVPAASRTSAFVAAAPGSAITGLAWARSGLVVAGSDGRVGVYGVGGGGAHGQVHELATPGQAVSAVAVSPDGEVVAAGTGNERMRTPTGAVALWRSDSSRPSAVLRLGMRRNVTSLAFSPDGRRLAAGLGNSTVLLIDVRHGRRVTTIRVSNGQSVSSVAFDGRTLLTGSDTGLVERWNPETGRQIGQPIGAAAAAVAGIAVDPGRDLFATTGGSDGLVKLWTGSSGQQLGASFEGRPGLWSSAQFTPDGRRLVVVEGDGSGTVWPATPSAWARHACAVAGREMTTGEWRRFVPGHPYARTCPR
jgi:WD40 repeat protein